MHVVAALAAEAARFPEVEFLDLGVGGLAVLHHLSGRRKALLLDCAYMNEPAGTLRRFTPDDVTSAKTLAGFSLHEGDLLQVLELARRLDMAPAEIVIFGIQPAEVTPGEGLSPVSPVAPGRVRRGGGGGAGGRVGATRRGAFHVPLSDADPIPVSSTNVPHRDGFLLSPASLTWARLLRPFWHVWRRSGASAVSIAVYDLAPSEALAAPKKPFPRSSSLKGVD